MFEIALHVPVKFVSESSLDRKLALQNYVRKTGLDFQETFELVRDNLITSGLDKKFNMIHSRKQSH